jgi:3-oxoacyl-[acyl-carrier-protein] synthase II
MKNKIVITKTGCISSYGIGLEEFIKNIQTIKNPENITIFDTKDYKNKKAYVLNDFDPKTILGEKGLRNLNRNTLFIISLLKNEFENEINNFKSENKKLGLTIGTAFGSLQSISDYELDIFEKGPRKINPMGFGNTVLNSPTSRANIWFGLTSSSTTISSGGISSAKAVEFSINQLNNGNVDAMLCGGAEELNMQTFLGYYLNKFLTDEEIDVYNDKSTGTILSEGCGMVLLETEVSAKKRNVQIKATIIGYGSCFFGSIDNKNNFDIKGINRALDLAMQDAQIDKDQIDLIITSANGLRQFDNMEEKALISYFGDNLSNIPVIPLKSLIGESIGAAGIFQFIFGSQINDIKHFPKVYKYSNEEKKLVIDKNFKIKYSNFQKILLNCSSECGNHSSIILSV